MNRLTIHIDVPVGKTIDLNRLQIVANDFMQKYVGKMYMYDAKDETVAKNSASFRKLRGVMSSDKSYKEMLEDALTEKYLL